MNSSDRLDESTLQDGLLLVEKEDSSLNGRSLNQATLSQMLPIVPLCGLMVYRKTAVPRNTDQLRSIRLLNNTNLQNSFISLCASFNREHTTTNPKEIYRAGLGNLILPHKNKPDWVERPFEIKKEMTFVLAQTKDNVLKAAPCRSAWTNTI